MGISPPRARESVRRRAEPAKVPIVAPAAPAIIGHQGTVCGMESAAPQKSPTISRKPNCNRDRRQRVEASLSRASSATANTDSVMGSHHEPKIARDVPASGSALIRIAQLRIAAVVNGRSPARQPSQSARNKRNIEPPRQTPRVEPKTLLKLWKALERLPRSDTFDGRLQRLRAR